MELKKMRRKNGPLIKKVVCMMKNKREFKM